MHRATCLALLCFTACFEPAEEILLLDDMPDVEIVFSAAPTAAWVEIGHGPIYESSGPCLVLHPSLRATVGDAQMQVTHPGSRSDDDECRSATLRLAAPPAADSLVLVDGSKQITIDLDGRLATLHPEQPWSVTAGSVATVRYTPADVLRDSGMQLRIAYPGEITWPVLTYTASSDTITFVVPDRPGSGTLSLWHPSDGHAPKPWPCANADCYALAPYPDPSRPLPKVPIQILPKAPR